MRNLFLIILFLLLGLNFNTGLCYVLIIILFLLTPFYLFQNKFRIPFAKIEDLIPLSFIIIWIYGLILGFYNGNKPSYIIANFAGMSCYFIYYLLTINKVPKNRLIKILIIASCSTCAIVLIYFVFEIIGVDSSFLTPFLGEVSRGSSTGQARIYVTGLTVAYTIFVISLSYFLFSKSERFYITDYMNLSKKYYWIFLFVTIFALFFVTASKGFLLGGIFFIICLPPLFYLKRLLQGYFSLRLFFFFSFLVIMVIIFIYSGYSDILTNMFDSEDSSNATRYLQLVYLQDTLKFWGNGLGAIIIGHARNDEAEYGFELTYINLIHKFGIISIILFLNWLYVIIKSFKNIYLRKNVFYSVAALGTLGYLFPSIGNPLLMHPACVILNCIALYFIRSDNETNVLQPI